MTDSILYLLAILVAANVVLIGVAVTRSAIAPAAAKREATLQPSEHDATDGQRREPARRGSGHAARGRRPRSDPRRDPRRARHGPRTDALTGLLLQAEWNRS